MFLQNLKSVALPVPEIMGVTKKFWQFLDTPKLPFLPNFNGLLFGLEGEAIGVGEGTVRKSVGEFL